MLCLVKYIAAQNQAVVKNIDNDKESQLPWSPHPKYESKTELILPCREALAFVTRKCFLFSGISGADLHEGSQVKLNLPIASSTKHASAGATSSGYPRKSTSGSNQAKQDYTYTDELEYMWPQCSVSIELQEKDEQIRKHIFLKP